MKVLMCPPTNYDVVYEINPWMDVTNKPDKALATQQWQALYELYETLGVQVELIDQPADLPDMVFTANGGTVYKDTFVSGNFRYQQRKGEEQHFQHWFRTHGYKVQTLHHSQGGEGDALFYKDTLYMGFGFRSDQAAHTEMGQLLGVPTVSLHLIDPYFYDFDTAFCPVGNRGLLYYPGAYDAESCERAASLENAVPLTKEQAIHFASNSVYVDGKLVVSFLDAELKRTLSRWDVEPVLLDISEYHKAGGGIKCLTLNIEN